MDGDRALRAIRRFKIARDVAFVLEWLPVASCRRQFGFAAKELGSGSAGNEIHGCGVCGRANLVHTNCMIVGPAVHRDGGWGHARGVSERVSTLALLVAAWGRMSRAGREVEEEQGGWHAGPARQSAW